MLSVALQAAFYIGAIFSSEIAGVFANVFGFAAAYLALAAIGLVALALAFVIPETQVGPRSGAYCPLAKITSCRCWTSTGQSQ